MGKSIPIGDLEKMLEKKKAERDKYRELQSEIRHNVTDEDYTPQELEDLNYVRRTDRAAGGFLPSKILDKTRDLMKKEYALDHEIKQLEELIGIYKKK